MADEQQEEQDQAQARRAGDLPNDAIVIVPSRGPVLFPGLVLPITISGATAVAAVQAAVRAERPIGIFLQRDPQVAEPTASDLHEIGIIANVLRYVAQKQHDIKAIVLNVDFFMFDTKADPYKDAYCYPYEKEITGLITNDTGSRYRLHRLGLFDISLCDDAIKYAALDGYSHLARTPAGIYKGFLPHNEPVVFSAPDIATVKPAPAAYSQQGFEILQQLLSDCQGKQWPLVLVIAPYYEQFFSARYVTNYDSIMNHVKQLAAASKIPVLDYSRIPLCSDTGMFFNVNHLNEKGAAIYTLQLARDISKILTK